MPHPTRPPPRTPSAPLPLPSPTAQRPTPRLPIRARANLTMLATFGPEPRRAGSTRRLRRMGAGANAL